MKLKCTADESWKRNRPCDRPEGNFNRRRPSADVGCLRAAVDRGRGDREKLDAASATRLTPRGAAVCRHAQSHTQVGDSIRAKTRQDSPRHSLAAARSITCRYSTQ